MRKEKCDKASAIAVECSRVNKKSYLHKRELHMLSLRSLAFACLNMRREDAFSANAGSADMARTATTATVDKAARRVLIFLTIVAQL